MNEDRIAGTARNMGGKVQEGLGRVTGDAKSQADGLVNQAAGAAQDLYGHAKDTAADAAQEIRVSFEPASKGKVGLNISLNPGRLPKGLRGRHSTGGGHRARSEPGPERPDLGRGTERVRRGRRAGER